MVRRCSHASNRSCLSRLPPQQWRLLPYLAAAYAFEHFSKSLFMDFVQFQLGQMMKDKSERQVRRSVTRVNARLVPPDAA